MSAEDGRHFVALAYHVYTNSAGQMITTVMATKPGAIWRHADIEAARLSSRDPRQ